jgi:hypothetical protein
VSAGVRSVCARSPHDGEGGGAEDFAAQEGEVGDAAAEEAAHR